MVRKRFRETAGDNNSRLLWPLSPQRHSWKKTDPELWRREGAPRREGGAAPRDWLFLCLSLVFELHHLLALFA
jgi:hypothetical protein